MIGLVVEEAADPTTWPLGTTGRDIAGLPFSKFNPPIERLDFAGMPMEDWGVRPGCNDDSVVCGRTGTDSIHWSSAESLPTPLGYIQTEKSVKEKKNLHSIAIVSNT